MEKEVILSKVLRKIKYKLVNNVIDIEEAQTLNWKYNDDDLSVVKYICNNTIFTKNVALPKLMEFVN